MKRSILFLSLISISFMAHSESFWSDDSVSFSTYQEQTTTNIDSEISIPNLITGGNDVFKTEQEYDSSFTMGRINYQNFINGQDYLSLNFSRNIQGESDLFFAESYKPSTTNSFTERFHLNNRNSEASKKSFSIILGHDMKKQYSPLGSNVYMGVNFEETDSEYTGVEPHGVNRAQPVNTFDRNNRKLALFVGFDTYQYLFNNVDWHFGFSISPYVKNEVETEYNQSDNALADFSNEHSITGWSGDLKTGLRFRYNRLYTTFFYNFSYSNGNGDYLINRYINSGSNVVDGEIDGYKNTTHQLGINFRYQL